MPAGRTAMTYKCIGKLIDALARRPMLTTLLVGLIGFAASAGVSVWVGMPRAQAHDEFSYLLQADTFAHGRLTNPTHPLWHHFESIHVIHQPSYASKYPPAHAMLPALGQVTTGHPVVGVWLSMGLMAAAIHWMLTAFVGPRWALLGAMFALGQAGPATYWAQSYYCTSLSVVGAALLLGGLRRALVQPRIAPALLAAIGIAVMANTRPFEGFLICIVPAIVMLVWLVRRSGAPRLQRITCVALPMAVVLIACFAWMAYYNWRVTGHALDMPYKVYTETYAVEGIFIWDRPPADTTFRHKPMEDMHRNSVHPPQRKDMSLLQQLKYWGRNRRVGLTRLWWFFIGPVLTIPLLMIPLMLRDRWMQFTLATFIVAMAGMMLPLWLAEHYAAPAAPLVFLLAVVGVRHMGLWRYRFGGLTAGRFGKLTAGRFGGIRRFRPRWFATLYVLLAVAMTLNYMRTRPIINRGLWPARRAPIVNQLNTTPGQHLVIVRYEPDHHYNQEWVYNAADIDTAKIIWAREMDPPHMPRLLDYYKSRKVWLLEPDADPLELKPYPD